MRIERSFAALLFRNRIAENILVCSDSYLTTDGSIVLTVIFKRILFGAKENLTTALSKAAVLKVSVNINYTSMNEMINKTVEIF